MNLRPFLLAVCMLCIGMSMPAQAGTPSGACRENSNNANNCQFEVESYTQAPSLDLSRGVRLNAGVNYVLFNNFTLASHPTIGPRFVTNTASHDIFIPQASPQEFSAFLNAPVPNIKKEYAVQPSSYVASPRLCALPATPTSVSLSVPTSNTTNPVVVSYYSLMLDPANPATTKKVISSTTTGAPALKFAYSRQDCSTDAQGSGPFCTNVAYREEQTLTFAAQGQAPDFKWGTPSVSAVLYVSLNGGAYAPVANCTTTYAPAINAVCGSSNGVTLLTKPTTNLCTRGNPTAVSGTGPWTWTCAGVNTGSSVNCVTNYVPPVNGSCGTSDGASLQAAPTTNLCTQGNATAVSGTGPWTWSCNGISGGSKDDCTASYVPPVNGACGTSDGQTMSSAPTVALCNQGTASAVSVTAPWTWSCYGSNGGTNDSCSANKTVIPTCTPTACKTCNLSGQHVNKTDGTKCQVGGGVWSVTNTKAGWCRNGHCYAHYFDCCSGKDNEVMCWKSPAPALREGTYEKRTCSACNAGGNVDNCSVCADKWGSGKAGDWGNIDRYFD